MKAAVDLKPTLTIIKTEKVDIDLFPSPGEPPASRGIPSRLLEGGGLGGICDVWGVPWEGRGSGGRPRLCPAG